LQNDLPGGNEGNTYASFGTEIDLYRKQISIADSAHIQCKGGILVIVGDFYVMHPVVYDDDPEKGSKHVALPPNANKNEC
jgi:hypothetical protein